MRLDKKGGQLLKYYKVLVSRFTTNCLKKSLNGSAQLLRGNLHVIFRVLVNRETLRNHVNDADGVDVCILQPFRTQNRQCVPARQIGGSRGAVSKTSIYRSNVRERLNEIK